MQRVRPHARVVPDDGRQAAHPLPKVRPKEGPSRAREAAQGPQQIRRWAPAQGPRKRLMELVRKKKRGQSQKVRRTWFSDEGYRIIWRKEVYGVRVPARYQACVRTL